jgi:uncharacterized membrane protein
MNKSRIETFTDGVIAIIITLMVLSIKLPQLTTTTAIALLRHISIYGLSFISIAIIWLNHHNMFMVIEKVDTRTIWTNLFLLFFMSLIPLPTKALGENFFDRESHVFFGLIMTATSITYSLLQTMIISTMAKVSAENKTNTNRLNWFSTFLYASSIPLSFISIYLSTLIFILIPIVYFIPTKKLHVASNPVLQRQTAREEIIP